MGVLAVAEEPISIPQIAKFADNPEFQDQPKTGFISKVDGDKVRNLVDLILALEKDSGVPIIEKGSVKKEVETTGTDLGSVAYRFNERFRELFNEQYPDLCESFNGLIADYYLKLLG